MRIRFLLVALFLLPASVAAADESPSLPTATEIVTRMGSRDLQRQGTQGQLRFLPVAHNDFIFSVLAEDQGFAGVLVALGLYLFVIQRRIQRYEL